MSKPLSCRVVAEMAIDKKKVPKEKRGGSWTVVRIQVYTVR